MSQKLIFLTITVLFLLLLPRKAEAIYDPLSVPNNHFGIHILETSELEKAAQLVNSTGGDWGHVTMPIRANDRDLPKWTKFMDDCRKLHLIPILRIASFNSQGHWMAPNEYDLVDFANFLENLPWPTKNRYIVVYNEPNHDSEWGGFVYPQEYARVLDRAIDIFHKKNPDFFVISAAMDSSAPSDNNSENEYNYFQTMNQTIPGIFSKIDGFATHSYGNPGFSSFPNIWSRMSVANYRYQEQYLRNFATNNPKIFITEAGWENSAIGDQAATNFYRQAFQNIWTDQNIVAITPFVLSAQAGPFQGFSWTDQNGNFKEFAKTVQTLPKTAGKPQIANRTEPKVVNNEGPSINAQNYSQDDSFLNSLGPLIQKILDLFGIHNP